TDDAIDPPASGRRLHPSGLLTGSVRWTASAAPRGFPVLGARRRETALRRLTDRSSLPRNDPATEPAPHGRLALRPVSIGPRQGACGRVRIEHAAPARLGLTRAGAGPGPRLAQAHWRGEGPPRAPAGSFDLPGRLRGRLRDMDG